MSTRIPVGIAGLGMVGTPLRRWFEEVRGYQRGRDLFCFDTDPNIDCHDDIGQATVVFVCVPTPPYHDGSCDTTSVESVVALIPAGRIVVIKSTVPPGTTADLQRRFPKLKLMFCPEFLTETQSWADFIRPSRQLIGVTDQSLPHAVEVLGLLPLGMFQRPDTPIYGGREVVTSTEAELAKYASNVFGAIKVVYANMLADLAWALTATGPGAVDYEHVRSMVASDLRIGPAWMDVHRGSYAGFGGFCFPKDMAAFIFQYRQILWRMKTVQQGPHVQQMIPVIAAGLAVLEAAYAYNQALLASQNLTVEDVSRHDRNIMVEKRTPIRTVT